MQLVSVELISSRRDPLSKFIVMWQSPPFLKTKNPNKEIFGDVTILTFLYKGALFLVKFLY